MAMGDVVERLRAGRLRRALRVALPADHPPLPLVVGLMLAVASANASTLSEPPRGVGGNVQSARSPSSPLGDANFAGSSSRGGMDDNPSTFGRRDTLNRPLAPNPKSVLRHKAWPVPTGARFLCCCEEGQPNHLEISPRTKRGAKNFRSRDPTHAQTDRQEATLLEEWNENYAQLRTTTK